MTNTPKTRQQLMQECQGLVRFLAAQIHRRMPPFIELDDLVSYGQLGLAQAAEDYDPGQGTKFSTFAYYRIRGAIYDGATKMQWFRHRRHAARYEQMADSVLQLSGEHEPPDETNLAAEASWFRNMTGTLAVVYLAARSESEHEETQDVVDRSTRSPMATTLQHEASEKLEQLIGTLPADSAALIRSIYFDGLQLQEAGERLGISKSWASRLHARALEQLARGLRLVGIDGENE